MPAAPDTLQDSAGLRLRKHFEDEWFHHALGAGRQHRRFRGVLPFNGSRGNHRIIVEVGEALEVDAARDYPVIPGIHRIQGREVRLFTGQKNRSIIICVNSGVLFRGLLLRLLTDRHYFW